MSKEDDYIELSDRMCQKAIQGGYPQPTLAEMERRLLQNPDDLNLRRAIRMRKQLEGS